MNCLKNILYKGLERIKGFEVCKALGAVVISVMLFSCADDLGFRPDNPDGEDFTGITLLIPNVEGAAEFGATRADDYVNTRAYDEAKDANFNTLYIAAIDDQDRVTVSMKTTSNGEEEGYLKYRMNLPPGSYRFYVVANLNRYLLDGNSKSTSFADLATNENAIRNLILNFNSAIPLEPGFLPMACLYENLKVDSPSAAPVDEDYILIDKNTNKIIYADLEYLCAKVRYTILFDFDKSHFAPGDVIDVHRNTHTNYPYVTNLRRQTALNNTTDGPQIGDNVNGLYFTSDFITESSGDNSAWPIFLDRYVYDGTYTYEGDNGITEQKEIDFYTETDVKKIKEALGTMTKWESGVHDAWTSETFLKKRAWQGVTYLPENLLGSEKATELAFPYSFNGAEGAESPKKIKLVDFKIGETIEPGIQRAMKYDVYVVITNPDPADWSLNVVSEKWTTQELAYQLHGPYELVVETSMIERLSMEEDFIFWFRSDVPPSEIGFISPQVSSSKTAGSDMVDIFVGKVVTDEQGNYVTNENGDYLFQVGINVDEVPYAVIDQLNSEEGLTYWDKDGNEHNYNKKDIAYFHLVAGSLNKRIEIQELALDPYLVVTPQTFIIDTRELYKSGEDNPNYEIRFETNVDLSDNEGNLIDYGTLTVTDPDGLFGGLGDGALKVTILDKYKNDFIKESDGYKVKKKVGELALNIRQIIEGNPFWDKNSEFNLIFTLTVHRQGGDLVITKPVNIKVKPFSGTYVIHFRDNIKEWKDAHIYVFQDLTLPANMMVKNADGTLTPYEYAGKIVGFIEENPSSGFQWNAALQYVFTNNMSFRGWHGNHVARYEGTNTEGQKKYVSEGEYEFDEYGGPSINNPWAPASYNATFPDPGLTELNTSTSTMGFVMFGKPDQRQADPKVTNSGKWYNFWNYDYSYNITYELVPNDQRKERYNYDVNFNSDHEKNIGKWHCQTCKDMQPDYNGTYDGNGYENPRFYPGITMEKEEDGWWKYTLTGVAQPGRTMIIFANWHEPWAPANDWFDYRAEDYRWPGDYEAGLPLFDFEDNEGWFLFDGNTSNSDQKFTDNKPTNVIPYSFTAAYSNLTIEVVKPSSGSISSVTIDGKSGTASTSREVNEKTITPYNFSGLNISGQETFDIKVTVNNNTKSYTMSPKNFVAGGNGYITAQPLYFEYAEGIKLYVKWNDAVTPNASYWYSEKSWNESLWTRLLFYTPPAGGSNYLNVYWGSGQTWNNRMHSYFFDKNVDKEIGNYKHVDVITKDPGTVSEKDVLRLRLCTEENGDNSFWKELKVEELPQYYYPAEDKYLINWHFLMSPYQPQKPW